MRVAVDGRDAERAMPHGSGLYVRRLLEALATTQPAGAELVVLGAGRSRLPEVVSEQLGLPGRLARHEADVFHGPDSFVPLRRPCPAVLTVHDLAFLALPGDMPARTELKYRRLVPAAARSAERVIVPSRFTAADLERRCAVPAERIRVVPEAPALPAGHLAPPPGPYLLAAGDLRPKKHLGTLVQAFARLHAEGLPHRLVLAGADLGSGRSLAALAGRAPVQLTGFVSDAELDALLRGADAVIVPGIYEGFGLIALDAMARARPTLLADAGALPELAPDPGVLFDPFDPADLAGRLRSLLAAPLRRAAWSVAAAERAATYTWERTARATWDVYGELA